MATDKQYRMSHTLAEMEAILRLIRVETDRVTDKAFDSADKADMEDALWWRDLRRRWGMRTRNAQEAENTP